LPLTFDLVYFVNGFGNGRIWRRNILIPLSGPGAFPCAASDKNQGASRSQNSWGGS
jgi:hypothetical protein